MTRLLLVLRRPVSGAGPRAARIDDPRGAKAWRFALTLTLAMAAGGCQIFERRPAPAPPSTSEENPSQAVTVGENNISTAIDLLENGEAQRARAVLAALREQAPGSDLVGKLLRQIDAPVERLVPGPYTRVEVGPGESLSSIAAREMGDPLLFYALARLNGIEVPARIPAGTIIRIPDSGDALPDAAKPPTDPAGGTAKEVEADAGRLAGSGQVDEARELLIDFLKTDEPAPESTHQRLVELTLDQAERMETDGNHAGSVSVIDEALGVVDVSAPRSRLEKARSGLRSRALSRTARQLMEQGKLQAAHARAAKAARLDPSSLETARLAEGLRGKVVESLHGKALVAWRNRNVDLAIRNWESLLEIAPEFEPARVYLERARSLRRRLDEP